MGGQGRIIEVLIEHTCGSKCYGKRDYAASCCRLEARDFIQGPVRDTEAVLQRLSARFGRVVAFDEVFIGHEEGSRIFADRPAWQRPTAYPAIRPRMDVEGFPCPFLGGDNRCTIYEDRPDMCRNYRCDHLKQVIDLVT